MGNAGIKFWILSGIMMVPLLQAQVPCEYTVEIKDPASKKVYVTLNIATISENNLTFLFPAWAPGNYKICNFGQWIDSVQAFDRANQPLSVSRKNVNAWQIRKTKNISKITYIARDIPDDSLESLPTSLSEVGADYFFFNGPALFGYLKNHKNERCRVSYKLPDRWHAWCSLDSVNPFAFAAEDYDELIDCPVVAGGPRLKNYDFEVHNARYTLVVNSESEVKTDTLIASIKNIVAYETNLFGETPFEKYVFIFNFFTAGQHFGALEHANSSAYYLPPPLNEKEIRTGFYARVIAHEFFHLWNPKRIHPRPLDTFDYQDSIAITSMWFIEGVTEYYAKLALVRTGLWPPSYFYNEMRTIAQADIRDNLEALSLQSARTGVAASMYTKGALAAFLMDIETRDQTNNAKSLDDAIIYLNKDLAHKNKNYEDRRLIDLFRKATGVNLEDFYKNCIGGTEPMPVKNMFAKAGLRYEATYPPFLGWNLDIDDDGQLYVSSFTENSTATNVGLQIGDVIKEIQQTKITADNDQIRSAVQAMDTMKVGENIRFAVLRSAKPMELSGKIKPASQPDVRVTEELSVTPKQKMIRDGILGNDK
jgi:predicted metalloprotease with PDZ domain